MAAILLNPLTGAIISELVKTGVQIFEAVAQANALNAKPDVMQADFDALDVKCQAALDASKVKELLIQAKRDAALKGG